MTLTGTMTHAASSLSASAYDGVDARRARRRSPVDRRPTTSRAPRDPRCRRGRRARRRHDPASPPPPARSCATTSRSRAGREGLRLAARTSASASRSPIRGRAAPLGLPARARRVARRARAPSRSTRRRPTARACASATSSASPPAARAAAFRVVRASCASARSRRSGRPRRRSSTCRPARRCSAAAGASTACSPRRRPGRRHAALRARLARELGAVGAGAQRPRAGPLRPRRAQAVRRRSCRPSCWPSASSPCSSARSRSPTRCRWPSPSSSARSRCCGPSAPRAVRCGGWCVVQALAIGLAGSVARPRRRLRPGRRGWRRCSTRSGCRCRPTGMSLGAGASSRRSRSARIVPLVASLRPARRAARVAPAAALRDAADPPPGIVGRAVRVIAGVIGAPAARLGGVPGVARAAQRDAPPGPHRLDGDRADDRRDASSPRWRSSSAGSRARRPARSRDHISADYVVASRGRRAGARRRVRRCRPSARSGASAPSGRSPSTAPASGSAEATVAGVDRAATSMVRYDIASGAAGPDGVPRPGEAYVADRYAEAHTASPWATGSRCARRPARR